MLKEKCKICGCKAYEVHHKDLNRKNNKLNNLVPLCMFCHSGLHSKLRSCYNYWSRRVLHYKDEKAKRWVRTQLCKHGKRKNAKLLNVNCSGSYHGKPKCKSYEWDKEKAQ